MDAGSTHPTRGQLQSTVLRLQKIAEDSDPSGAASSIPPFTLANFMALIVSAEGTPYLFGGIDPFHGGADCSGLIYWGAQQCGVTLPRTTEAEWADLPHSTDWQNAPVGSIVEFEVPSDGGSPPQHVGVVVGPDLMIDDPHTGAVVRQEAIPNEPGVIWPIGYCLLPFVAEPKPPTPPALTEEPSMFASDPKTGGIWATDANGDTYPAGGAPLIPGLNTHPDYHAGSAESGGTNPCVGIAYWEFGLNDGIYYITAPTNGEGGWDGSVNPASKACPYSLYRFLRNGQPA